MRERRWRKRLPEREEFITTIGVNLKRQLRSINGIFLFEVGRMHAALATHKKKKKKKEKETLEKTKQLT